MSKLDKLKEKARSLEAKDPKGALEAWLEVLKSQGEGEENTDLTVYNRIGDLYLKLKDPGQAADYYDHAVDKYAELGFHNNAIALCNKVLRNAPTRQGTYLKLAKLYASKGFLAEAKQNFVEYAGRMQKAGKIQQAFAALKELTALSPGSPELREALEEHLKMYGAPERQSSAGAPAPEEEPEDLSKSGKRKTSSLVFLDLDEPPAKGKKPGARPSAPAAPAPPKEVEPVATVESAVVGEPDSSLEIETTSLAPAEQAPAADGMIDGFERTIDFGEVQAAAPSAPSIRKEPPSDDIAALPDLQPTAEIEAIEPEVEPPPPPPRAPRLTVPKVAPPKPPPPKVSPPAPRRPSMPAGPKAVPPKVQPVVPKRPIAPAPPPAQSKKRSTVVEVPPLELEPDFATETTAQGHEVDDEPLAVDAGLEEIVDQGGALTFANIEEAPATPIEELEARVAEDPDDPEAHRALGEALVEAGERERGIQEMDHATAGFENRGDLDQAQTLVQEILRLDPNSVRHRQKQVEYAFKRGDKTSLLDAYLELADTLLRSDLPEKARAVYQRVVDHDPANDRAKGALAMLAPVSSPVPVSAPRPKAKATEGRVAPKDAKMKVRDETSEEGDFVDLGAMILEEEMAPRDTRMKVADEEPTGDEEKDFRDMLARFRQGIDENIEETDFQSHYDLGVAFKEMGLLDEAIAEFQKALQAPEGKLKTSEALGMCFFEKNALVVAESVLRRALEFPAASEQERLGVCYWLGRTLEAQGKRPEAREQYGRVFSVDIRFADVGERVKALAKAK